MYAISAMAKKNCCEKCVYIANKKKNSTMGAGRSTMERHKHTENHKQMEEHATAENQIEGRNAVLEAFRSGKTIDKLYVQKGLKDGPVQSVLRAANKTDAIVKLVEKERLDQMSETGHHQGVIAIAASYAYAEVEDILKNAREKGEDPFILLLDGIEDPHNLGAIIRTANLAGAHGVIIPKTEPPV